MVSIVYKFSVALICVMSVISCSSTITSKERRMINREGEYLRVLTVADKDDSTFLRKTCKPFSVKDVQTKTYAALAQKMVATMTSPEQDGVGIAGPQVGVSRRVIAVMRMDKEGEPVEVYANPRIIVCRGDKEIGPEGCLSVPDCRGNVMRYRDITVRYLDPESGTEVSETIEGYTAIIFQHEIDHLDGILYTDKLVD